MFGDIKNDVMTINDTGEIAKQCWLNIPKHFPNIVLREYVIMPNHIHGILEITNNENNINVNNCRKIDIHCRGTACRALTFEQFGDPIKGSIPTIIRSYKSAVTKQLHNDGFIGSIWQRNYYEHIIRNDDDYKNIVEYIIYNPAKWVEDKLKP